MLQKSRPQTVTVNASRSSASGDNPLSELTSALGDLFRGLPKDPLQSLESRIMQVLVPGEKALPQIMDDLEKRFERKYNIGRVLGKLTVLCQQGAVEVSRVGKIEGFDGEWRFFKLTGSGSRQLNKQREASIGTAREATGLEPA